MKKSVLGISFFVLCMMACRNHSANAGRQVPVADTARFYPLSDFFKSQLQYAKTVSTPIYRITVKDGKKDSVVLTEEQFNALAAVFLDRNISSPAIKVLYKESVFHDLGTKSYTLNYSPVDKNAVIQGIDVLLDEETNNVKRVFIRSKFYKGDTSIMEQCNWKAYKSFQVNRYLQAEHYTSTELNYINWNNDLP